MLKRPDPFQALCPTRRVLDRIGDTWAVLILIALDDGTLRFNELRRRIENISQKMLSQTLRNLEHVPRFQFFLVIVSAMPPRIAADASNSRDVIGSASSTTPPRAAMAGTLSWIVAADVAESAGNTAYQRT